MGNKVFNVNGEGKEFLQSVLEIAFKQNKQYPKYWRVESKFGLILSWYKPENKEGVNEILGTNKKGSTAQGIIDQVYAWVSSEEAFEIMDRFDRWDHDLDHDGHNIIGWRVYCDDWGHVGGDSSAICAIRPVYLWCGK